MNAMNKLTRNQEEPALHEVESSELQAIVGGFDLTPLYHIVIVTPVTLGALQAQKKHGPLPK